MFFLFQICDANCILRPTLSLTSSSSVREQIRVHSQMKHVMPTAASLHSTVSYAGIALEDCTSSTVAAGRLTDEMGKILQTEMLSW